MTECWRSSKLTGGKPKTVCTVVTAIEHNRHQLVRALAVELHISQESIRQILTGKSGMKSVLGHGHHMDEIQACFHACTKSLTMIINELEFPSQVITADE